MHMHISIWVQLRTLRTEYVCAYKLYSNRLDPRRLRMHITKTLVYSVENTDKSKEPKDLDFGFFI